MLELWQDLWGPPGPQHGFFGGSTDIWGFSGFHPSQRLGTEKPVPPVATPRVRLVATGVAPPAAPVPSVASRAAAARHDGVPTGGKRGGQKRGRMGHVDRYTIHI